MWEEAQSLPRQPSDEGLTRIAAPRFIPTWSPTWRSGVRPKFAVLVDGLFSDLGIPRSLLVEANRSGPKVLIETTSPATSRCDWLGSGSVTVASMSICLHRLYRLAPRGQFPDACLQPGQIGPRLGPPTVGSPVQTARGGRRKLSQEPATVRVFP